MSPLLRCSNGHEWEARPSVVPGGALSSCPVCGSLALTTLEPPTQSLPAAPPLPSEPPARAAVDHRPILPGYEILEELGRGGMGIVYKARQRDPDRLVALKVIRKERLAHPEMVSRFRREAQAAARLSHPNIVVVHEADAAGDTHFLAMEFVPGLTLQRLVEQFGPLPVAQACDFIRQTALGLQHASEQALVHRDIKPANLMVVAPPAPLPGGEARRGAAGQPAPYLLPPRPVVKILDMGVARLYQLRDLPEDSLTTLTRDGSVIGTPDYIAPEQLEDPHRADIRADLYSLGCTFYFLLSGRVPFPGGTLIQKLDRQRWETPPSVDQLRAEVPRPVAAVVRRLMAKHPDDRYSTPGELADALEQLSRTGVLPGGHQPAPLREQRCLRGHTGPVIGVVFHVKDHSLVTAGADRTLRVWDLETGTETRRFEESPYEIGCLAVVPESGQVLAGQGASVRIWDPSSGRETARLTGHTDAVRAVSVSRDGRLALTGGDDRTLRLWDLGTGREIHRLGGHRAGVTGVALSPNGRLILSSSRDGTLRLWDLGTRREVLSFPVPRGPVLGVAFAPEGQAVSGHFDTTVRLWEVASGRELRRFSGHRQMVAGVTSADGRVISCSHDQTVRIWDPGSGCELWCCQGHSGPVVSVAVDASGLQVASGSFDQTVRLWRIPE